MCSVRNMVAGFRLKCIGTMGSCLFSIALFFFLFLSLTAFVKVLIGLAATMVNLVIMSLLIF